MEHRLNLAAVLEQVGKEKNIDRQVLISALEDAVLSAARKKLGPNSDLEAKYNPEVGEVEIYEFRRIVKEIADPETEIEFENAKKLDPTLSEDALGEDLGIKLDSKEFGRIAAQNAKQIILQRVKEAERSIVFEEYKHRKGELVTGIARRFERGNVIVDLGRSEAVIPVREQVSKENIRAGERIVAYVLDVLEVARGAQIVLSRTHPNLVAKLFEQEVPEIAEGTVRIESVSREPGFRTKIAVHSKDSDVDPVGACVGMKGIRVHTVVQELKGEKIDIVPWDKDEARFVCNALAPAEVSRVLVDEAGHSMMIVVPDDQLSLAIGRRGQNVRLAAELTGWKIDIQSEARANQERDATWALFSRIEGLGDFQIQTMYNHGLRTLQSVVQCSFLHSLPGFDSALATRVQDGAQHLLRLESMQGEQAKTKARVQAQLLGDLLALPPELVDLKQLGLEPEQEQLLQRAGIVDLVDVFLDESLETLKRYAVPNPEQLYQKAKEHLSKHASLDVERVEK